MSGKPSHPRNLSNIFQALFISLLSPKISKALNVFGSVHWYCCLTGGWDSIISIETCYRLDTQGFEPLAGTGFPVFIQTGLEAHFLASFTLGPVSFQGVKWLICGFDHHPFLAPRLWMSRPATVFPPPSMHLWHIIGWTLLLLFPKFHLILLLEIHSFHIKLLCCCFLTVFP